MTEIIKGRDVCSQCGCKRIGRMPYCPKCGTKFEIDIPLKRHSATYKRCMDCKWFRYYQEGEIVKGREFRKSSDVDREGVCECKREFRTIVGRGNKRFSYKYDLTDKDGGYRSHTTKACKYFEEKE